EVWLGSNGPERVASTDDIELVVPLRRDCRARRTARDRNAARAGPRLQATILGRNPMSLSPILVTGAAGFVGARIVESCNARAIDVMAVGEREAVGARRGRAGLDFGRRGGRREVVGALRRGTIAPRAILHLGAITATTELREDKLREQNLESSQDLWRHAVAARIPFVYASSAATYGGGELGYDDDESKIERLRPLNPYGESKRRFDLWVLAEERAGRMPPSWSGWKFFNVYGFGERHKGRVASVV